MTPAHADYSHIHISSSNIRHHLRILHLSEELQGQLPLEGLLAGTDQGAVGDHIGAEMEESKPGWADPEAICEVGQWNSIGMKSTKTKTNNHDLMIVDRTFR